MASQSPPDVCGPPPTDRCPNISDAHAAELARSGIPLPFAAAAGVATEADPVRNANALNWKGAAADLGPCLHFPFFDPAGNPMRFADARGHQWEYRQLKPTCPRLGPPTAEHPGGKAVKYEVPLGSKSRVYVPLPVREKVCQSTQLLIITEGPKKALKAAEMGFAAVGLTGVWNWGGAKAPPGKAKTLNADFDGIPLTGRTVVIVFDSDAAMKEGVRKAEAELVAALRAVRATVVVLRLPAGDGAAKVGLDDYAVAHGDGAFKRLVTAAVEAKPEGEHAGAEGERKAPAARALVLLARAKAELWHDDAMAAWATVGVRSMKVRSPLFRQWLTNEFRLLANDIAPADALANALGVLESEAVWARPLCTAHVRVGGHRGHVYLALYDTADTIIEIGPGWWRPCDAPPIRFARPPAAKAMPVPVRGGSLDALRDLLNFPADASGREQFALLTAWLCGAFLPDGPFPVLVLGGEHGSAKSTTAKALKLLTDPTRAELRKLPKDSRDLMVAAANTRVLAFDNLSNLPQWFSDDVCSLATGGGFSTRALYADDQEAIFDAKRPVILGGIEEFARSADLLDRAVSIRLPAIPDVRRVTEEAFWAGYRRAHAAILGAVLDRVAVGLGELPRVALVRLPRMADFARFAFACEGGGAEALSPFLAAYALNRSGSQEQSLEDSPVAQAVIALMADRASWEGSATELLTGLDAYGPPAESRPKEWPTRASALTNTMLRLATDLRRVCGIDFHKDRRNGGGRARFVALTRVGTGPPPSGTGESEPAEHPSPHRNASSANVGNTSRDGGDVRDGQSRATPPGDKGWRFGSNGRSPAAAKGGPL